jgi:hypothetical protein
MTEPVELSRLRRLAESPDVVATLADEHVAAIRWAVRELDRAREAEAELRRLRHWRENLGVRLADATGFLVYAGREV